MAHIPYITPILKVELLVLTSVIVYLLITAITKKDMILSETAFNRFKSNWSLFKSTFYIGVFSLSFFTIIIGLEFVGQIKGAGFRDSYPVEIEIAKVGLVTSLTALGLLNMYILNIIAGDVE